MLYIKCYISNIVLYMFYVYMLYIIYYILFIKYYISYPILAHTHNRWKSSAPSGPAARFHDIFGQALPKFLGNGARRLATAPGVGSVLF